MRYIDLLEGFVVDSLNYSSTEGSVAHARKSIQKLNNEDFSALLSVSGYIPDSYTHDSSEETMYSKLVELLVCEWSQRIGFTQSSLPTQKSSMEDITIQDDQNIIVADAKSFRLSRSQASPNVKDVLKEGDYKKWISRHNDRNQLGGIITFPQMFEWKKSSDVHSYLTQKNNKIMLLYYSHLSAILTLGLTKKNIIEYFKCFDQNFPNQLTKDQNPKDKYFTVLYNTLFRDHQAEIKEMMRDAKVLNKQIKESAILKVNKIIEYKKTKLQEKINSYNDFNSLKKYVVEKFIPIETSEMERLKLNIEKFR